MSIPPPASSAPSRIDWEVAPAVIRERVAALAAQRPVVVAICGPVGAGKSTLAHAIGGGVVRTDDYLPDYALTPEHERDLPERSDVARMLHDLATLRRGAPALLPTWSFHTHRREGERLAQPTPLIVVEGIHALHEPVLSLVDVRVYVEAPANARWNRWEVLESTGQRGWGVERARAYFHGVAEPTFARFEAIYRAAAEFIVVNP
jgi:uridine kinase